MTLPQVFVFARTASRWMEDVSDAAIAAIQSGVGPLISSRAAEALAQVRQRRKAERARRWQEAERAARGEAALDEPDVNELWPEEEG